MVALTSTIWTPQERKLWAPPPDIRVSEWADRDRYIPYGAEPGPWRTDRIPYTRDIMDAYSDPEVDKITITGPAQSGKTESVFNMIGSSIALDPVDMMYVIAVDGDLDNINTDRLQPIFRSTPSIADHLTGRPWDTKTSVIRFDRMKLYFTGAGSASALASKAIGRLFLDETDKYGDYVGAEGHPAKLAERRGTTYGDFKVVYLCTPTTKDGFIIVSWKRSNMMKYWVPCPHCGNYQLLVFGRLKVDPPDLRDPDTIKNLDSVYYECLHCSDRIPKEAREEIVARGVWCPEGCKVSREGELLGTPLRSRRHCGFWITELLSPWLDWTDMLAEFFEIQQDPTNKVGLYREFVNQVLGQTFEEPGKKIEIDRVKERIISIPKRAVPTDAKLLVSAADYHADLQGRNVRVDYNVLAVSPGLKFHKVIVDSAPSLEDYFNNVLFTPFPWADPEYDEDELAVMTAFIDSGYDADTVYDACRPYPGVAFPIKGIPNMRVPYRSKALDKVLEEASELERRKKAYLYRDMLLIDIFPDYFKDIISAILENSPAEERSLTFHEGCPDWFFTELTNEHKVKKKNGRQIESIWTPRRKGAHTHGLDIMVYALAAVWWNKANITLRHSDNIQKRRIPAVIQKQIAQKKPVPKGNVNIKRKIRTNY